MEKLRNRFLTKVMEPRFKQQTQESRTVLLITPIIIAIMDYQGHRFGMETLQTGCLEGCMGEKRRDNPDWFPGVST